MASSMHHDDNGTPLPDPSGFRPTPGAAGIVSATMSASVQELTIPTVGQGSFNKSSVVRISTGPQPALYAVDKAGQGASYSGIANMVYLPLNWVEYVRINQGDVSLYVLQGGTAGTVQLSVLQ